MKTSMLLALYLSSISAIDDSSTNIERIAEKFRFPAESLRMTDITQPAKAKTPQIIAAWKLTATDDSFAPVRMFVTPRRGLLNEELENWLKTEMQLAKNSRKEGDVRSVELQNGLKAYWYPIGLGTGGESWRLILADPSRNLDVAINLDIPGDPPLKVHEATKEYREQILRSPEALIHALETCVGVALERVKASDLRAEVPGTLTPKVDIGMERNSPTEARADQSQGEQSSKSSSSHTWLFWGGIVLGMICLSYLFFKRREPQA